MWRIALNEKCNKRTASRSREKERLSMRDKAIPRVKYMHCHRENNLLIDNNNNNKLDQRFIYSISILKYVKYLKLAYLKLFKIFSVMFFYIFEEQCTKYKRILSELL